MLSIVLGPSLCIHYFDWFTTTISASAIVILVGVSKGFHAACNYQMEYPLFLPPSNPITSPIIRQRHLTCMIICTAKGVQSRSRRRCPRWKTNFQRDNGPEVLVLPQLSRIKRLNAIKCPHFMRITIRRHIEPSYLTMVFVSSPCGVELTDASPLHRCEPPWLIRVVVPGWLAVSLHAL